MNARQKKRTFLMLSTLLFAFIMLCSISSAGAAASVREQMEKEATSLTSLQSFYETHTKPYERRYIIQYAPEYLVKFAVTEAPAWIIKALDEALNGSYDPLVVSAIQCIGELKIESFSDELTDLFISAPQKSAAFATSFRMAVLDAMKNFNEESVNKKLHQLIKSYSELLICDPAFDKLMETVVLFGDESLVSELSRFEAHAQKRLETNKDDPERQREYARILQLISRTKHSVSAKGGKDE